MTLKQAFDIFRTNLDFTEGQQQQFAERRTRLVGELQQAWRPAKVLSIGSWSRGTAVPPLGDIDLMVVLGSLDDDQRTPGVILADFKARLDRAYPSIPTRMQARSIGLRFEDFAFDVVPALAKASGGYRIPALTDPRKWIFTNPEEHARLARDTDQRCGAMALPLVRMLKVWNTNRAAGLKSFHLEVMLLRALKQAPASYAEGARVAFESLARDVKGACGDPGGSDNRLDTYLLPESRAAIAAKLEDAARQMKEAIRLDSQEKARSVFGNPFP